MRDAAGCRIDGASESHVCCPKLRILRDVAETGDPYETAVL